MNSALSRESISLFESIKQYDENGNEYWTSRNLSRVLEYADYRNFIKVIEKAKTACANSGQVEADHFVDITEMVIIGSGAPRNIDSIEPVEYAIFQNYGYQGLYGGLEKTPQRGYPRQGRSQSDPLPSRGQGASDNQRTGRHNAGRPSCR